MESKVRELMELRRMKEELEAEITAMEDEIKGVMGEEETLLAGDRTRCFGSLSPLPALTVCASGRTTRSWPLPTSRPPPAAAG